MRRRLLHVEPCGRDYLTKHPLRPAARSKCFTPN